MQIETVAARRSTLGIELFAVHSEPKLRLRHARRLDGGWLVRIGLCVAFLLAIAGIADLMSKSASARSVEPAPVEAQITAPAPASIKPLWIEVNRPIQLFALAGSAFSKLPLTYHARRRSDGAERQDFLAYGQFGSNAPSLSLSIQRTGADPERAKFFVAMARLAAEHDLGVVRSGNPSSLATRFGAFATTDLTLAQGSLAAPCLGFRLQTTDGMPAPVDISGFACGTAAKPMDRDILACVLDRIDLVSAGDDAGLQQFFVDAERRRGQGCRGAKLLAGARDTWLDGEVVMPPLKHLGAGHAR